MESKDKKYRELISYLKELKYVAIAFSAGVDSTFLLKAAKDALVENVIAYTVKTPYMDADEIEEAIEMTKKLGVKHKIIEADIIEEIKYNPENRCYLCKTFLFQKILEQAKLDHCIYVLDGTNFDDLGDFRPGMVALKELGIISPLLKLQFTKQDIRELSKDLDLKTFNKPANPCLLTRLNVGEKVSIEELLMIKKSEDYLRKLGFLEVRVRSYKGQARIEIKRQDMDRVLKQEVLDDISTKLKDIGYKYVSLDLAGYKMGNMNK
ncbi:MAG: ATP-dependent sacrificial sulfur transferase LarE [Clostridiaceae bacterium]